ncbi:hypothetical protein V1525DRAFT_388950 [Lipomyces kononenkoae]|uniref:Uncharacterized protein n=1 Tax=Lipomyces kononenkoae TaxID=34357 RepID=A0ACC3SZE5_LIPKO
MSSYGTQQTFSGRRKDRNISIRKRVDKEPRSRSGCLTCRLRHKRCDQRSPTCMNCERLDIHCRGYVSILRWRDCSMKFAQVAETTYRSLRYVNFHSDHYRDYGDEIDTLMELYAPFDVLTDSKELIRPPIDITAPEMEDQLSSSSDSTTSIPRSRTPVVPSDSHHTLVKVEDCSEIQTPASAPVGNRMSKALLPSSTTVLQSSPISDDGYPASPCSDFSTPLLDNQQLYTSQPQYLGNLFRQTGLPDMYLDCSDSLPPDHPNLHDLDGLEGTLLKDFRATGRMVDVFYGE